MTPVAVAKMSLGVKPLVISWGNCFVVLDLVLLNSNCINGMHYSHLAGVSSAAMATSIPLAISLP